MLRFIFCPNERFNINLCKHTQALINAKALSAALDDKRYSPMSLFQYIHALTPEVTPVIVLCDKYGEYPGVDLALKVRMVLRNVYLIYISDSNDDLLKLTNGHTRISGYLRYQADIQSYNRVVGNIWRDYTEQFIPEDEKFVLVVGKQMQTFFIRDILYFESQNKKVNLNTLTSQVDFYESLSVLQERLKHRFIRCHNSYLVNAQHIQKISLKDHEITLTGHVVLKISDTYKQNVLDLIARCKDKSIPINQ